MAVEVFPVVVEKKLQYKKVATRCGECITEKIFENFHP